ncbi:MAG: D-2-hydroxyacid dehydrogenase family protein [Rhodobacteraceae bacterium]|nr:D-2-hydroxyacid dehydrogenase family protein [Paracoccaceae bacterium]
MFMRIAILDDWSESALSMADWTSLGDEIRVFSEPFANQAEVIEALQPFEILCLMRERTPFPAEVINALPNLKLIVTTGNRNLAIDTPAARARGVEVCGTRGRKTTTSELTLAMLLSLSRRIIPEANRLNSGGFQGVPGRDLAGLRLGVIGLGSIGGQIAAMGKLLGMDVAAWSPNLTDERCAEHNTSRAGLIDREGLFNWLHRDPTAMAGIDVFESEPLPANDPWRAARSEFGDRLLLTPHLGYVTDATWRLFYQDTVEAIAAFKSGTPIRLL